MMSSFSPIQIAKALAASICILIWMVVGWRMQWGSLMVGKTPLLDFDTYYQTAIDVRRGTHPLTLPYMQTAGPPSVIIPYIPFSFLPLPWARSIMSVSSLFAIVLSGWFLSSAIFPRNRYLGTLAVSTLLLLPFPTRYNLGQGQPNIWLMAIVSYLLVSKKEPLKAGLVSLMMIAKTNYLILATCWLRSRTIWITLAVFALILSSSLLIVKPSYYFDFIQTKLAATAFNPAENHDVDYYNQSLKSTLGRFGVTRNYGAIFIAVSLLGVSYLFFRPTDLSSGVLLSLLLSPLLWQHYVVVAYPIAFLTLATRGKPYTAKKALMLLGLLFISFEMPWLHGRALSFPDTFLASHFFIGLVILLASHLQIFHHGLIE